MMALPRLLLARGMGARAAARLAANVVTPPVKEAPQ